MSEQPAPTGPKPLSRFQRLKAVFRNEPVARVEDAYGLMHEVGGFIPMFNIRDLEQRRSEIEKILQSLEGQTLTDAIRKDVIDKTFRLFFLSGSPWYRGLNNRELSGKASDFLWVYNDIGHLPAFTSDIFMCSIQLLHLSFQALDVTNTPAYVIHTTPVITPQNVPRINMRTGERNDQQQPEPGRSETIT